MRLGQRIGLCGVVAMSLMMAMPGMAQGRGYMTVQGTKQGKFKASSGGRAGEIGLTTVLHQPMTRGGAGKHTVVITKQIDTSSPQLFEACRAQEVLTEVALNIGSQGNGAGAGKRKAVQRVVLRSARISNVRKVGRLEEITFNYEAVEVTFADGSKSATDDWTAQN